MITFKINCSSSVVLLAFCLVFLQGCLYTQGNVSSWQGKYVYEETPVESLAGYNMVMSWDLSIKKVADMHKSILNVSGQQTTFSIVNDLAGNDSTLFIIYDKLLSGPAQAFQHGDTLFSLSKKYGRLKTKWNKLTPILREPSPNECDCFVFSGTIHPIAQPR